MRKLNLLITKYCLNKGVLFTLLIIGKIVNAYGNNEFLIDTNIGYIAAVNNQESPCVAFDGINYLIVWEDERSGSADIYGARVSPSGVVLDPLGIVISNASDDQKSPVIAFDGTNYLVVWQDYRNGTWDIYGTRITQSGVILDSIGITISNAVIDQEYPSITFDGSNYLVVWHDTRNGPANIYCARVTQSGFVLDLSGIPITTANYWQEYSSVAFDGSNYLVVWEDGRSNWDIYGARVTPSGAVLDSSGIRISTAPYWQWAPSVAFDGTNYLVVWEDLRNGPDNSEIYGTRVDQNGLVLDPIGIAISTALYWQSSPSVIFNGTYYLVVWDDERGGWHSDIYGARVNQSGIILDPDGIVISNASNEQKSSIVAFDGNNYLSVWQDYRNGAWDIYSTRISSSGIVIDSTGIAISTVANEQLASSIAFDGTNYLVVWQGESDHSYDIYGLRVNDSGLTMDSTRIAISTTLKNEQYPSVIFDGTNYLVVWEDYRNNDTISDIYGARVDQYGIVLDSAGIAISTAPNSQYYASLAFDGTNYLIVWEDERSGSADIYGARMSQSGVVLDPTGIVISTALNSQKTPSVDFDGTNYLVVWEDKRRGASDIYGTRISQSGTILDPEGFYIIRAVYFWQEFPFPSVSFDGLNYLVVWEDDRNIN